MGEFPVLLLEASPGWLWCPTRWHCVSVVSRLTQMSSFCSPTEERVGRGIRTGLAKGIRTGRDFSLPFLAPGGSRGQLRTTEGFFPPLPISCFLFKLLSLEPEMGLGGREGYQSQKQCSESSAAAWGNAHVYDMDIGKEKGKACCLVGRC